VPRAVDRKAVAEQLRGAIAFHEVQGRMLSPADMLLALLGVEPQIVDGPAAQGATTWTETTIPAAAFQKATVDAADFIRRAQRLPNEVFIGAQALSLPDFAATLAGSIQQPAAQVPVVRGRVEFDRYFATDPVKPFN